VREPFASWAAFNEGNPRFSALTGTWETLEMEQGVRASAETGPSGTALVVGGSRLYSFDAKTGHFQEVPSQED
jgi:hypothetical protein